VAGLRVPRAHIHSDAIGNFVSSCRSCFLFRSLFHTQIVHWKRDEEAESCQLLSFRPSDLKQLNALTANDTTRGALALHHLRKGQALVYSGGDYHNARQLLQAVKKKNAGKSGCEKKLKKKKCFTQAVETSAQWMQQKQLQREQTDILQKILIQVSIDNSRPSEIMGLKRTPGHVNDIFSYAFKNDSEKMDAKFGDLTSFLLSLSDFLGMVGGYEWHRKGVYIDALQDYIYPHFGVFPPTRQDYIKLLNNINCDRTQQTSMLEVGVGSGVLSIILLQQKKVDRVIGTDVNPYAIACATDNVRRFGFHENVHLEQADLFPPGNDGDPDRNKFDIVLFNPPWIPGDAATWLDRSVYDPEQNLLRRFLLQAQHHVNEAGYIYLLLSNLGVLLGLIREENVHAMFREGNLELVTVHKTKPKAEVANKGRAEKMEKGKRHHPDRIANARAQEVISLYKLRVRK